ncbi:MAG: AAA family ATPase [Candidatus Thiodiazotropha sp. (ex Lucinoma kastoroae)]|nr:AAA family ATPase [Candidatus Thiodiazotropha sp. (ex Lucinoma kastoroae)]
MDEICSKVVDYYLGSDRFNGSPIKDSWDRSEIRSHIEAGIIEIVGPGIFPNPHIKPFSKIPIDRQIAEYDSNADDCCLYPGKPILEEVVKNKDYESRPYTKRLALGGGQLDGVFFDLSILEQYRNDPRYYYWADDINGQICIKDEHYESAEIDEKDKVLLETFGFGFNDSYERCVVSLLWYISTLSKEHQQIWAAKEFLGSDFKMHPDYYRNNIVGDWGERLPICEAFIMELSVINKMANEIKSENLFRKDYSESRPKEFAFLIRPTLSAFNSFVLLLDQMMSDNINKKYFADEIADEYDYERDDGKVEVRRKGTIAILEEWIDHYFRPADDGPIKEMKAAFRKVRKLRQKPAHSIQEDAFDQKYIIDQRELMLDAYGAVRTLRQILANHPRVKTNPPDINEQLWRGDIWHM